MKRFSAISILLLLLGNAGIYAQTSNDTHVQQLLQRNQHLMHAIEARQQSRENALKNNERTTGESERLIGKSTYDILDNAGLLDTMHYAYSSNRTSFFDFNNMVFDASNHVVSTSLPTYIGNDLIDVMFDTSIYAAQEDYSMAVATYDANNNLTQLYDVPPSNALPSTFYYKYINVYDANENVTEYIEFIWDSGVWDTSVKRMLTYNGNMITSDSAVQFTNGAWEPIESWSYGYNNAGNITTANAAYYNSPGPSAWQYFFTYNTDNTIQKDSAAIYSGGSWMPLYIDSVGYTAGINSITYEQQTAYQYGITGERTEYTRHYTNGLPDTIYRTVHGMANGIIEDGSYKNSYSYDSYGNPVTVNQYAFHTTTANSGYYDTTPALAYYYYYQTFTTDVKNIVKQQVNITVYPNPATDEINISQTGMQQGALTYIKLINALGQIVHSESLPWMNGTETVSVAGLRAGDYWVVIQDKDGNVLSRKAIVKE